MLRFYTPGPEELSFRQTMLEDDATMAYSRAWGGTIPFPREKWADWYRRWFGDGTRFYRYLQAEDGRFVGDAALYPEDGEIHVNLLIYAPERGRGFGRAGLALLCAEAKRRGIARLYDDIAADNTAALALFTGCGFTVDGRMDRSVPVKKELTGEDFHER